LLSLLLLLLLSNAECNFTNNANRNDIASENALRSDSVCLNKSELSDTRKLRLTNGSVTNPSIKLASPDESTAEEDEEESFKLTAEVGFSKGQ